MKKINIQFLLGILCLFALAPIGCNKPEPVDTIDPNIEKYKADAEFNGKLVPGLGNVFREKKLIPGQASQLALKLNYLGDEIAYYGKINTSGQIEILHSAILKEKDRDELFVLELHPNQSISRRYQIINGVKQNFVIQLERFSESELELSILDYDWSTNTYKTISSMYMQDGKEISNYSMKKSGRSSSDICQEPAPDDLYEELKYFACGALALESHPVLDIMNKAAQQLIERAKAVKDYFNKPEDQKRLERLQEQNKKQSEAIDNTMDKSNELKYSDVDFQNDDLKKNESDLGDQEPVQPSRGFEIIFSGVNSKRTYDETAGDTAVRMSFHIMYNAKIYSGKPIYARCAWINPSNNTLVHGQLAASDPTTGLVTFTLNPKEISNYKQMPVLRAECSIPYDENGDVEGKDVTFQYIQPSMIYRSFERTFNSTYNSSGELFNDRDSLVFNYIPQSGEPAMNITLQFYGSSGLYEFSNSTQRMGYTSIGISGPAKCWVWKDTNTWRPSCPLGQVVMGQNTLLSFSTSDEAINAAIFSNHHTSTSNGLGGAHFRFKTYAYQQKKKYDTQWQNCTNFNEYGLPINSDHLFIPFRVLNGSNYHYGWIRISIHSNSSFTLHDLAINPTPNAEIKTGQK